MYLIAAMYYIVFNVCIWKLQEIEGKLVRYFSCHIVCSMYLLPWAWWGEVLYFLIYKYFNFQQTACAYPGTEAL